MEKTEEIQKIEEIELEIIDLDDKARGIARHDGIIYFVENAKLGEVVNVDIVKNKKNYIIAKKIKTVKESPFIIKSKIKESKICGIYDLYDIDYKYQVEFKKNNIINTINRISKEEIKDINFLEADKIYNYRNKVELKLSPKGKLSYFSRTSNDNIEIEDCLMVTKEINEILPKLQSIITEHNLSGYNTRKGKGIIKNIILRSTSNGEVMCVIVYNEGFDFTPFYNDLEEANIFDSFYVSYNNKRRNYKINELVHIFGKLKIVEKLGEYKFNISPRAFFQVNKSMSYEIYKIVKKYVEDIKPESIIDLYSGVSTTSIILSDTVKDIISVEVNTDAVEDAKENALLNNVDNIKWINEPAEVAIDNIDIKENTVALFDPPRRGLELNIIEKIGESEIKNIIYISCDVSTLARDIARFKEYGYSLVEVTGVDQFVNTIEVETIVMMSRK